MILTFIKYLFLHRVHSWFSFRFISKNSPSEIGDNFFAFTFERFFKFFAFCIFFCIFFLNVFLIWNFFPSVFFCSVFFLNVFFLFCICFLNVFLICNFIPEIFEHKNWNPFCRNCILFLVSFLPLFIYFRYLFISIIYLFLSFVFIISFIRSFIYLWNIPRGLDG